MVSLPVITSQAQDEARPGRGPRGDRPPGPAFMTALDANKDGKLAPDELPERMKKDFKEADLDTDGALGDRDWALRVRAAALLKGVDPTVDVSKTRPAPNTGPPELNDVKSMIAPAFSPGP